MAVGLLWVLAAASLWLSSEAARVLSTEDAARALGGYDPDERLVACQRRWGARNVWSWFKADSGGNKDVRDGEELIYKGDVDEEWIKVTWKGEMGQMLKANTKSAAEGCKVTTGPPRPATTGAPRPATTGPPQPATTGTPQPQPDGPHGEQLPLVVAKYHDPSRGYKSRFKPRDEHVESPDTSGVNDGQVMQCVDVDCGLNGGHHQPRNIMVRFRGVAGTVERRNVVAATKEDYDDFYNPDIVMGPCGARLARPSEEEMALLRKLFTIHDPASLGKGRDVQDGRPSEYNSLRIRSAWKVLDRSPKIKAYKERIAKLNADHGGREFELDNLYDQPDLFPPNGLNKPSREKGWLEKNEYWMVRGADPKYSESLVCEGGAWATMGMFAHGIYLADAADKMDQYVSPVDKGADGLMFALNSNRDPEVDKAAKHGTRSVGMEPMDVYVGEVMRAYMGHHVELQLKRGKEAFWRDPALHGGDRDKTTGTHERSPPFGETKFDSMKVVCADTHHENTHPDCEKRGGGEGNFPYRWNEYVVPGPDGFAPADENGFSFAQTAVLQYLVAYDRVQE